MYLIDKEDPRTELDREQLEELEAARSRAAVIVWVFASLVVTILVVATCGMREAHAAEQECPRTTGTCTLRVMQGPSPDATHVCAAPVGEAPELRDDRCVELAAGEIGEIAFEIEAGAGNRTLELYSYAGGVFSTDPAADTALLRDLAPPTLLELLAQIRDELRRIADGVSR